MVTPCLHVSIVFLLMTTVCDLLIEWELYEKHICLSSQYNQTLSGKYVSWCPLPVPCGPGYTFVSISVVLDAWVHMKFCKLCILPVLSCNIDPHSVTVKNRTSWCLVCLPSSSKYLGPNFHRLLGTIKYDVRTMEVYHGIWWPRYGSSVKSPRFHWGFPVRRWSAFTICLHWQSPTSFLGVDIDFSSQTYLPGHASHSFPPRSPITSLSTLLGMDPASLWKAYKYLSFVSYICGNFWGPVIGWTALWEAPRKEEKCEMINILSLFTNNQQTWKGPGP